MQLNTLSDIEFEIKKHDEIINHYKYLNQLKLSFVIFNCIEKAHLDELKFCLLKTEYDDEGLSEGAYFDVKSAKHEIDYVDCENYEVNYNNDYQEKAGEHYYVTGDKFNSGNAAIDAMRKLNEEVFDLLPNTYIEETLRSMENRALKPNLENIILEVCGKENFKKWSVLQEKNSIAQAIPAKTVKTKKIKL